VIGGELLFARPGSSNSPPTGAGYGRGSLSVCGFGTFPLVRNVRNSQFRADTPRRHPGPAHAGTHARAQTRQRYTVGTRRQRAQ